MSSGQRTNATASRVSGAPPCTSRYVSSDNARAGALNLSGTSSSLRCGRPNRWIRTVRAVWSIAVVAGSACPGGNLRVGCLFPGRVERAAIRDCQEHNHVKNITIMCWRDQIVSAPAPEAQEEQTPTIVLPNATCPPDARPVAFIWLEHPTLFWVGLGLVIVAAGWQIVLVML